MTYRREGTSASAPWKLQSYGGMYSHDNASATDILKANVWHLLNENVVTGLVSGATFITGSNKTTTLQETSDAGAKTKLTCATHGMSNGWVISIANTTNYDGVYVIEQVTENTFVIAKAFAGDEGSFAFRLGAGIKVTVAGKYRISFNATVKPANANDTIEVAFYQNATYVDKAEGITKTGGVSDFQGVGGQAHVDAAANDIFTLCIKNQTGANDFTITNCNVLVERIA